MGFEVADAYDRFMGRYSRELSHQMADLAGIAVGQRVLDVGSGPGALTTELVARVGSGSVVAVDPSAGFVEAVRERLPGVDVHKAAAEELPFEDGVFDATLAQLVVHFMKDPVRGLHEMARVTRSGGLVAACVWDLAGGRSPLGVFWRAARDVDPDVVDESHLPGAHGGHLAELMEQAGLHQVLSTELQVPFIPDSFDDWWEPFTLGVGPAGDYVKGLDDETRAAVRERCRQLLPTAPRAVAWAACGVVA
jgi:SAM-dependent methyltransferase